MNRFKLVLTAAAMAVASVSQAAIITVAGDPIGGGNLSGSVFTIGSVGGGANQFPANETAPNAINNDSGATKYLNHTATNSGYIVTPVVGFSNVTGINFTTANDTPVRDPSSYSLYGSNSVTASSNPGDTFNLASFTLINSTNISLSDNRFDSSVSSSFSNAGSYSTYLLIFPTVKNTSDGNMQIGDAILTGVPAPEPATATLLGIGAIGVLFVARRRRSR